MGARWAVAMVGCLVAAQGAWGQPAGDPAAVARPAARVFSDEDGLPQNTVHAMAFDARGYLWVGTQDGAVVSNGRGWRVVNMPGRVRSNFVRVILPARDGSLLFGTQGDGLHRLVEEQWEALELPCPGSKVRINALGETTSPPAIWAATHDCGVFRFSGGAWTRFGTADGLPSERVWGLLAVERGDGTPARIWVGTQRGIAVLAPGDEHFRVEPGFPTISSNSFLQTTWEGQEELWVGTFGDGVHRLRNGRWSVLGTEDGLPGTFVTCLARRGNAGPVWVGTDGGGLAAVSEDGIRVVDAQSGLPSNAVYALLPASAEEGGEALWVGTRSGGMVRLLQGRWQSLQANPESVPLPVMAILPVAEADGGAEVWFGTDGGGLAYLDGARWRHFNTATSGLPSDVVQCLLASRDEAGRRELWVGTRHGGLARLIGGRWQVYNERSGTLSSDMVQSLAETHDTAGRRELWVGTRGGLTRFAGGAWQTDLGAGELPHRSVQVLLVTHEHDGGTTVWIGTADGVGRFRQGRFETVEVSLDNRSVQALGVVQTPGGRRELWIGTDGGGVSRLDLSPRPQELPPLNDASSPPLPNNVVYQVLQDRSGRIYLFTNRGVARLTWRGEDEPAFDLYTYTADDGLPANQTNRGAGALDHEGRLWVGTVRGAAVLDPAGEADDQSPKPLRLEGLSVGDEPQRLQPGARLPRGRARLLFEYALLSYFREDDTRYRTQLAPLEAEPSAWVKDGDREVGPLPPGSYTFRAWGRDYAGNVSGPEEIPFIVARAPWQTWWAYLLYLVLATGAVAALIRARLTAHRRHERELQGLVDARTRELEDANHMLNELSYLDPVTGIGNRRRFQQRLDEEWRRAIRAGAVVSLVMVDIDFFKPYNDTYGHQQGDDCLRTIAAALADGLPRSGDAVARWGGEEFAIILPLTGREGAVKLAESLRLKVEGLGIPHSASSVAGVVTISCGVATVPAIADVPPSELTRLADESLYVAKHTGRNRTAAQHGAPRRSS